MPLIAPAKAAATAEAPARLPFAPYLTQVEADVQRGSGEEPAPEQQGLMPWLKPKKRLQVRVSPIAHVCDRHPIR